MDSKAHYQHSSLRERIVEHVFVGDALRELWKLGIRDVEILRSEFDAYGYDIVMSYGAVVRHVQFKASTSKKPGTISIARSLFEKPSGCVICIGISAELVLGPFYWLGAPPGEPLPRAADLKTAKGRRNKEGVRIDRKNHVYIPSKFFVRIDSLREVLRRLFDL
ncbi:hypothetical protein IF803_16480 [Bradyrhizobium sp. UFLA06-06]